MQTFILNLISVHFHEACMQLGFYSMLADMASRPSCTVINPQEVRLA